jgi:hypothetical protein
MFGGALAVFAGGVIEKRFRVDDAVGAVAVHGVCGFFGIIAVGLFATGYPTGINNVSSSFGGQMMGLLTFLPLGFFGGYVPALILKKAGLLRVPPEVELEGLDIAEFGADFFPEFAHVPEVLVNPDGELVESAPLLAEAYGQIRRNGHAPVGGEVHRLAAPCSSCSRSSHRSRSSAACSCGCSARTGG